MVAQLINLTKWDILYAPDLTICTLNLPRAKYPPLIADAVVDKINCGFEFEIYERIPYSEDDLPVKEDIYYIVNDAVKKAYYNRKDVLTVGDATYNEQDDVLIVRKFYV